MNDQERAVMQKALEALDEIWSLGFRSTGDRHKDAITTLRAALAHQEREPKPVAWIQSNHLQQAQRAPFLCRVEPTQRLSDFVPLYTAPPRREWQSLSEEEIGDVFHAARNAKLGAANDNSRHRLSVVEIARAIEAKLKEKNA